MLTFKEFCIQEELVQENFIKDFHRRLTAKMGTHGVKGQKPITHAPAPRDRNTGDGRGEGVTTLHRTDGDYTSGRSHAQSIIDKIHNDNNSPNKAERKRQRLLPPSEIIARNNKKMEAQ